MFGLDIEIWNNLIVVFGFVGAAFTIFAGGATYIAYQLQKMEAADASSALEKYKLETAGKVADAKAEGIRAGKAASEAQLKASEANERAAKAELELAKYRAQRGLSPEAQKLVAAALKQFAGIKFDAALPMGDTETARLLATLEDALQAAGLIQIPWTSTLPNSQFLFRTGKPVAGNVGAIGVILEVDGKTHPELVPVAEAIATTFTNNGVPAKAFSEVKTRAAAADAIHLLAGNKS